MLRIVRTVALLIGLAAAPAMAQTNWPEKPVKLVVGFTAGSATDVTARMFAQKFQEAWGQPVVVENIAGNSGAIGTDRVAKSAPDGYTLMWAGNAAITILPSLQTLPFDPLKDLTPISTSLRMPSIMMVNNDLPVKSIAELIAYAKANPGKLSYGVGNSTGHIAGETIKKRTGTDIVRVSYRSNPAVVTDLIAGHIPMAIPDFNTGLPQLKTQKVRALAVLTKERNRVLPDVPTLSETVMPGFDILAWAGMFGPANLPPEIVKVLADAVQKALSTPLVIERLNAGGTEVFWSGPQDFSDFVKTELAKWTAAIKEAGIEPE